jgi:ABC-type transporter lipoprotein component MlaA
MTGKAINLRYATLPAFIFGLSRLRSKCRTCEYRKDSRIFVFLINKAMNVVSTKEFKTNQEKYLNIAMTGKVYIQLGDCRLMVTKVNERDETDIIFDPDEDFYMSITMDEVKNRLHKVVDNLYEK